MGVLHRVRLRHRVDLDAELERHFVFKGLKRTPKPGANPSNEDVIESSGSKTVRSPTQDRSPTRAAVLVRESDETTRSSSAMRRSFARDGERSYANKLGCPAGSDRRYVSALQRTLGRSASPSLIRRHALMWRCRLWSGTARVFASFRSGRIGPRSPDLGSERRECPRPDAGAWRSTFDRCSPRSQSSRASASTRPTPDAGP